MSQNVSKLPSKWYRPFTGSERSKSLRNCLAEFFKSIPSACGWWYRLPLKDFGKYNMFENCMLHICTLFGLLNYTICIILFICGILKRGLYDQFSINPPGFIAFQVENKLLNLEIELGNYRRKG